MVLISHTHKFIYIKNKKVAGTSIESYFEKYCLDPSKSYKQIHKTNYINTEYGIIGNRQDGRKGKFYNHISAKEIHKIIGDNMFNTYFKFCVVRNPYDKMVSLYHMLRNGNKLKTFDEFCKKNNCKNYNRYFINNKSCINFYIRYENLNEDLKKVCEKLGIEFDINRLPNFKSEYRQKNDNYQKYYNDDLRKIVYKKHKKEFEMFGYKFK